METKKTNSVLIVIIIVLAVLVIGGIVIGAYFWGKSKTGSKTQTTASPTITTTKSAVSTPTTKPSSTTTANQQTSSAREFVEKFMKMTLGTLPGASLDLTKARTSLSDVMQAQYQGEAWVPQFYGIQDGPSDFQFLSENQTEDGAVLKYNALFGNEVGLGWTFTVAKDGNNWFINGFSNTAQ